MTLPQNGCAGETGLPCNHPGRCKGHVHQSSWRLQGGKRGVMLVPAHSRPSSGHALVCPNSPQYVPDTPDWTQSSPPPSWDTHEESRNQLLHARQRGAIFSTSSKLTSSFSSKKKKSLFHPLCFSAVFTEVPQKFESRWEEVLIWTSCQASLPCLPYF